MRFVRENLFYVVLAAVVAAGGGAAVFYYLSSDIGKTLKSRTQVSSRLKGLAGQPLKVARNAVDAMETRIKELDKASKADLKACMDFNRANLPVLLLPTIGGPEVPAFPVDPARYRERGLLFMFRSQYSKVLEQIVSPLRGGLMPTTPPTREEIEAEKDKLTEKFKGLAAEKAFQSVKLDKARQGLIYADVSALGRGAPLPENDVVPEKLWEAQVNLWLTDEIVRAIIATNRQWIAEQQAQGAAEMNHSVLNSAVKRLESINVFASFTGQRTSVTRQSMSQRETCSQFAIVPYRFAVVMPTRHIRRLIGELETQNYHTVTNISLSEVQQTAKDGYYYGTEPIMSVQIDGEMLLLADGIRDLMPASLAVQFGKVGK